MIADDFESIYFKIVRTSSRGRLVVSRVPIKPRTVIISNSQPLIVVPYGQNQIWADGNQFQDHEIATLSRVHSLMMIPNGCLVTGKQIDTIRDKRDGFKAYASILAARMYFIMSSNSFKAKSINNLYPQQWSDEQMPGSFDKVGLDFAATLSMGIVTSKHFESQKLTVNEAIRLPWGFGPRGIIHIGHTAQEMKLYLRKITCNAFTAIDHYETHLSIGIYDDIVSRINHSCIPNSLQLFGLNHPQISGEIPQSINPTAISILVTHNIEQGDEITISYINVTTPTWLRRQELFRGYGFTCDCRLCVDDSLTHSFIISCTRCRTDIDITHYSQCQSYYRHQQYGTVSSIYAKFEADPSFKNFLRDWCLPYEFLRLNYQYIYDSNSVSKYERRDQSMEVIRPECCRLGHDVHQTISILMTKVYSLYEIWIQVNPLITMIQNRSQDETVSLQRTLELLDDAYKVIQEIKMAKQSRYLFSYCRNKIFDTYTDLYAEYILSNPSWKSANDISIPCDNYLVYSVENIQYMMRIYPLYNLSVVNHTIQFIRTVLCLLEYGVVSFSWCLSQKWFQSIEKFIKRCRKIVLFIYNDMQHDLYKELEYFYHALIPR